jgi:hypothetical protein
MMRRRDLLAALLAAPLASRAGIQQMLLGRKRGGTTLLEASMVADTGNTAPFGDAIGYVAFGHGSLTPPNIQVGAENPVFAICDSAVYGTLVVAIYDFGEDPGEEFLQHVEIDSSGPIYPSGYSYDNTVATWTFPSEAGFLWMNEYQIRLVGQ